MSKLYNDASLLMIPSSVKDGKLYNIFPQPKVISGELVTNGTFDTDSDWDKGAGWSIANGKAISDGVSSNSNLVTTSAFYSGSTLVKMTINVADYVSGGLKIYLSSTSFTEITANGNYTFYTTADRPDGKLYLKSVNFNGSVDNVSVKEVDQLPADFDFSRGSNLAATRINEQGLIEKGRENLLLQSNQFDTTWSLTGLDETSGQIGYDGSSDAWKLNENTESTVHYLFQTASITGVNTFSIYLKAGTKNKVQLYDGTNNRGAKFNLETKSVYETSGSGFIDYNIEELNDGWAKYSITGATSASSFRLYLLDDSYGISYTGDSANYIYIQDAQLEVGLVATDYIESGATTGKAGVLEDLPRLDWSGSCPTLLLEPQRQNLITQSEYINGISGLSKIGTSIDTNVTTSPQGLDNASLLKEDSSNGSHFAYKDFNLTSGNTYSISIFAKANGENKNLRLGDGGVGWSNDFDSNFDLTLGTATNGGVIEDYGNGWYRCSVVGTANAASSRLLLYSILGDTTDYQGDGVSGVYLYGFQLEQGSYATSYIPTHGTSVTRSADETELVSLPNELSGDFSFYLNTEDFSTFNAYLRLNDSSGNYVYAIYSYNNHYDVYNGSSFLVQTDADPNGKLILKREEGTIKIFINGENKTLSGAVSNNDTISAIEVEQQTNAKISIKELAVFDTALSDNECINLTTI